MTTSLTERGSPLGLRKRDESRKPECSLRLRKTITVEWVKLLSLPHAKQARGNLARDDQEADVQITRNSTETAAGPNEWFTGSVYIDAIAAPSNGSRISASSVHFTPGARTAWHTHPHGQTIWVSEGVGLCQRRGGSIEVIRAGDRVFFEPGEEHWHGAASTRVMTHLALLVVGDDGSPAAWGEPVPAEE